MGRPRKADELKRLEGNPGRRDLNKAAPQATGNPECPDYLSEYAREVWKRITDSMPPALYAACDSHLLAAYCVAASLHRDAVQALKAETVVVKGQNGAPYQNPWTSILSKQAQLLATLGGRLGLDPAARNSLSLPQSETPESRFGDLIAIGGGRNGLSPSSKG